MTNQSDATNMTKEVDDWTLDSFGVSSGSAKDLKTGFSMDSAAIRSVFYIGNNRDLYQVTENSSYWDTTQPSEWVKAVRQPSSNWPAADVEYADLGMAFNPDSNRTWIYYISNKTMMQVHQSGATKWETALALPKFNSTPATDTTTTSTGAGQAAENSAGGLSSQAKIGLGVGVGVGIPLIVGAIAFYMFSHVRSSRTNREAEKAASEAARLAAVSPHLPSVSVAHSSMVSSPAAGYNSGSWEGVPAQGQPYYSPQTDRTFSSGYYSDPNKPLLSPPPVAELPIMELRQEMSADEISEMAATEAPGQVEEQTNTTTRTEEHAQPGSLTTEKDEPKTTAEDQPHAK
jgi:hypothetical protein